jgi:hypothetical protein
LIRYLLIFWAIPLGSFWGWFSLSYFNAGLGTIYLTRGFHDLYFDICGQILGVPPASVPMIIAKACLVDTLVIFGLVAIGRRRRIFEWLKSFSIYFFKADSAFDQAPPAE